MEAAFFHKAVLAYRVYGLPRNINWIEISGGDGVIEVNDPALIEVMRDKVKKGIGGLTEITAEQFAEKKTLPPTPRRLVTGVPGFEGPRLVDRQKLQPSSSQPQGATAAVAGETQPEPKSGAASVMKADEPKSGKAKSRRSRK